MLIDHILPPESPPITIHGCGLECVLPELKAGAKVIILCFAANFFAVFLSCCPCWEDVSAALLALSLVVARHNKVHRATF